MFEGDMQVYMYIYVCVLACILCCSLKRNYQFISCMCHKFYTQTKAKKRVKRSLTVYLNSSDSKVINLTIKRVKWDIIKWHSLLCHITCLLFPSNQCCTKISSFFSQCNVSLTCYVVLHVSPAFCNSWVYY